ncbi:single-stranded-DNA-specific exonuclease RecJ [bacterium]|nr:single-stranded-DNA-specific exonuclease RecJ [bacterium]
MNIKWEYKKNKKVDFLPEDLEISSILFNLLIRKKLYTKEEIKSFLNPSYEKDIIDPYKFYSIKIAVSRIKKAVLNKEKICIYGDYDADGVTSCFLLYSFIRKIGGNVIHYIPNRETEGYGLNNDAIDNYIKNNNVSLIITVDTGIVNCDCISHSKDLGIDVIVTDHHEEDLKRIPKCAIAIIDPKMKKSNYPFTELSGCGVAFKLCQAIALSYKDKEKKEDLSAWLKWNLDLVAISIVTDIMPAVSENRVFLKYGLIVLNKTRNLGLKELIKTSLKKNNITSSDIGFVIGPRLNAAGRMDHANTAFYLLKEKDKESIASYIRSLSRLNTNRQKIVSLFISEFISKNNKIDSIIIIRDDNLPVGIIGLVASKLKEHYNLPCFVFSLSDGLLVGSGRSLDGYDITKVLKDNEKYLVKFGGHKMACGCSLEEKNYNDFKKSVVSDFNKFNTSNFIFKKIIIDLNIKLSDINRNLLEDISKLEPFGKDNEIPIFSSKKLKVTDTKIFGKTFDHFRFTVSQNNIYFNVIAFSNAKLSADIFIGDEIDLVYELEENIWNGTSEIRLKFIDYKKLN